MPRVLRTYRLGRVEYEDGLALMRLAADAVRAGTPAATDFLFLLEHPPVLTLGRSAGREHIVAAPAWLEKQGFEIHETDRGGDVTYHGPGQIVGYPVLDLNGRKDVRRYVGALEEAMIRTCADFGVEAGRHPEHRGCWVGRRKIGAIGVHLSRWITSHGFAFNARTDLAHFQVIVPCGIADPRLGVTSLEAELAARGRATPEQAEIENRLAAHLADVLELARADAGPDLRTISVVPVRPDGRVLLLRRSVERGGFWQQVTGRIEPGEAPEQAARRELREETGADLPVVSLGYRHAFGLDPSVNRVRPGALVVVEEVAFAARVPDGFEPRLSGEHTEHAWATGEEAAAQLRFPGLRRAVRLALSARR
ncbi:lipoate-protein ligase B [Anaeromyxobacter sp. K]|uniref:Octanoyltransferase n=1 Tax=Anaeromyxobacter dehalogenans (strain ATCC BAA-258 / DSM 21875 / 2CP-1) TaxID=455488 RepID=B8J944_ANAD2|nr:MULTISPECIES: lipoyl(octanoyl) transferase LipB [Anaeromyxobacter]ACG73267.1 lipoate-protein ligase B [Anaeromyxobacter sp. K]ACL65450.1 lipoate-protein ligase B [Anaeromyxobacter dehalogenans 2CP-1]